MFKRLRAAIAAFVYPELMNQTPAPTTAPTTDQTTERPEPQTTNSIGTVSDHGTAVQARNISGPVTFDRSTTETTDIHNTGGIVNTGGTNSFTNTHISGSTVHNGHGNQTNNVTNTAGPGASVGFQAGHITGGTIRVG